MTNLVILSVPLRLGIGLHRRTRSRSKAIYWDGRNGLGEQVASGVYFYTLTAGDYCRHPQDVDSEVGKGVNVSCKGQEQDSINNLLPT